LSWQLLKTGFSERPTLKQNLADSSSSLAFAIACHKSSGPQGHTIFIDLRNREEQRVEGRDEQDKQQTDAHSAKLMRSAEKSSQAKFEKIEQGMVLRLLRRWFKAARVKFNLHRSGTTAMKEWRTSLQNKEEQADQEWEEKEGTGKGRQMRASAHEVKERERARLQKRDPAERIQNVKDMWEDHCKTITGEEAGNEGGSRVCDIFDVCAVSFFRNVLLLARNLSLKVFLPLQHAFSLLYLHCTWLHCVTLY
jgi:hypothetical protein